MKIMPGQLFTIFECFCQKNIRKFFNVLVRKRMLAIITVDLHSDSVLNSVAIKIFSIYVFVAKPQKKQV